MCVYMRDEVSNVILKVTYYATFIIYPLFMSLMHKHASPLCKEILKVSGKNILSLFVLIHLYKNLSENELIRFWPLYDVITFIWLV